jgi:hypothetical protein
MEAKFPPASIELIRRILDEGGAGAEFQLLPGENQRAVKHRLSRAAGKIGYRLKWSRSKKNYQMGILRCRLIPLNTIRDENGEFDASV